MKTSLTSVTFRSKTIQEVVDLTEQAGIDAIEWGSDVHVPPTDPAAAETALRLCRERGIAISAYGSYFRCGDGEEFAPILENALRLGTRVIRVWAGERGSAVCSGEQRRKITENLQNAARMAAEKGCIVATEYHPDTLTDTLDSALQLLADIPELYTYWQPDVLPPEDPAYEIQTLQKLGKRVVNVHVFYMTPERKRAPLAQGEELWLRRFRDVEKYCNAEYAAIEFVKDGTAEQFLDDAAALKRFVTGSIVL